MRRAVCSGAHVVALWCGVLVRLPWRAVCSGAPACRVVRPLSYTPYRTPAPRRTPCRDCSRCLLCSACRVCNWSAVERRFHAIAAGETPLSAVMFAAFATGMPQNADFMQSRLGECPFRPEHLPRLQLKRCRTPFLCNRGRKNAPFGPNACRVCIWNAAEGRFRAIAAGEHHFWPEHLPRRAVCSGATACCIVRPLSYTPHLAVRPAATAHAVCAGVKVCRVCNWNASEGRFCAIAAGKTPLSAGMPCRVCNWRAVEGRFRAIAAEETPLSAGMLAAFAAGVPQRPISCNRGRENTSPRRLTLYALV